MTLGGKLKHVWVPASMPVQSKDEGLNIRIPHNGVVVETSRD